MVILEWSYWSVVILERRYGPRRLRDDDEDEGVTPSEFHEELYASLPFTFFYAGWLLTIGQQVGADGPDGVGRCSGCEDDQSCGPNRGLPTDASICSLSAW